MTFFGFENEKKERKILGEKTENEMVLLSIQRKLAFLKNPLKILQGNENASFEKNPLKVYFF